MTSEILRNIQEEVTCPICLELLTEPWSLDCGHSFCQACIAVNSQEASQAGKNGCPVCRTIYEPSNMRPNRHLTNVVEKLREVKLSPEKEEKIDLCTRHGEKLLLFCKEDWMFICWLCERSQEHCGHHTFLIEEAAKECQERIQASLEILRRKQQKAELFETDLRRERTSWQKQIENEIQSVQKTFKQMRKIMDSEEQKELQKLREEKKNILHDLTESEKELVQQSDFLRSLISDLEHRLQASTKEMLNNVNAVIKRSETLTLTKPKTFTLKQRTVFQVPDLRGILLAFNELKGVQRYWVQMTLKAPDKNPGIIISLDGRQVRRVHNENSQQSFPANNYNNDYYVLGSEAIKSGKCYWEVDVSDKREWIVGVRQIFQPPKPVVLKPQNNSSGYLSTLSIHSYSIPISGYSVKLEHSYSSYEPKFGYWVIGLQNNSVYNAFVDSSSYVSGVLTLSMTVPPCRIGVFVDYEARTVSFYNVTNHGFLIYKFSSCSFTQNIFPYFNLKNCFAPMTLCSPTS